MAATESKTSPLETGLFDACARLSHSPAVPVTVMVMVMVPAMPTMMAVMSPVHLRRLRLDILLDCRRRAGIAERQRIRALGWRAEREQCANGCKS
jgi:hypothetical protein